MSMRDAIAESVRIYLENNALAIGQAARDAGDEIADIAAAIVDNGEGANRDMARIGRSRNVHTCEHCRGGRLEFVYVSRMHDRPVYQCQGCGRETYGVSR
jgi:hypothetical protein